MKFNTQNLARKTKLWIWTLTILVVSWGCVRRRPLARECRPRRRWELVEVKQLLGRVSRNLGWNYSVEPFLLGMR